MKYILKLIIGIFVSIILLYVLFPIVLGLIIFNDSRVEELDVDYSRVIAALKPYDRYDLHVNPLEGGQKYSVLFEKGMDHICVVRVDQADAVIKTLSAMNMKKESGTGSDINSSLKWYYDSTNVSGYYSYHLDAYNYYVVDEKNSIVWYVQFST